MKITAAQGVVLVTLVLGAVGGVFAEVQAYLNSADLTWLGPYAPAVKTFFASLPYIVAVTWLYSIFGYLRQTQIVKSTPLPFDTSKFIQTLSMFAATIGPVFQLAPTPELKQIGAFAMFVIFAVIKEAQNVQNQLALADVAISLGPDGMAQGLSNGRLVYWYPGKATPPAGTVQVPYGLSGDQAQVWASMHSAPSTG